MDHMITYLEKYLGLPSKARSNSNPMQRNVGNCSLCNNHTNIYNRNSKWLCKVCETLSSAFAVEGGKKVRLSANMLLVSPDSTKVVASPSKDKIIHFAQDVAPAQVIWDSSPFKRGFREAIDALPPFALISMQGKAIINQSEIPITMDSRNICVNPYPHTLPFIGSVIITQFNGNVVKAASDYINDLVTTLQTTKFAPSDFCFLAHGLQPNNKKIANLEKVLTDHGITLNVDLLPHPMKQKQELAVLCLIT